MTAFTIVFVNVLLNIVALYECSIDDSCYQFQDLDSWNHEYVTSLCNDHGNTDKSTSATLCDAYVGNLDYENSLKLAILNTMYGTEWSASQCPQYCMYDPLNFLSVGFKWNNNQACWNVLFGANNPLCYVNAWREWNYAYRKATNWCCPPDNSVWGCSFDNDCTQQIPVDSWNQEYVESLCSDHGDTDKSVNAALCDANADNAWFESMFKLAILNKMYGTGSSTSQCPEWCMYGTENEITNTFIHPIFQWNNNSGCWNVYSEYDPSPLCHNAVAQLAWSNEKTYNFCCHQTVMPSSIPTRSPTTCSVDNDCYLFHDLASWNQEYVTSLCIDHGNTDKSTTATLCDADDLDYENSLKLAIVNTMYGTGASASHCPHYCMYDPLNVHEVGFKWNNNRACWKVLVGATNNLCYITAVQEWMWSISKTENLCCPSDPTA